MQQYIASGIFEIYCLGLASPQESAELEMICRKYPEARKELEAVQLALEGYAYGHARKPSKGLKEKILARFDSLQSEIIELTPDKQQLRKFIQLSDFSDHRKWLQAIDHISPPEDYDVHLHELFDDGKNLLHLAWVKKEVPAETHDNLHESFFILEGTCECRVGAKIIRLKPGDYLSIPLHLVHDVRVTSQRPVKALLSRVLAS